MPVSIPSQKTNYPNWYLQAARQLSYTYPDMTLSQRFGELYKRLSWVATAVDIVSIIATMTGKQVVEMDGEDETAIINHEFEIRLSAPNPMQSGRSFWRALVADYVLQSKCYIWLNIVGGSVVEMWRVPTTMIAPHASGSLGIDYFAYSPGDGTIIPVPIEQIVYISDFDPINLIEPDSSLTSIAITAQSDISMQRWSAHTYDGNGRLPGVMTFADMVDDVQWRQIGDDIDSAAKMQNILRLRGTGTGAVGWIPTSVPPKDMEFYIGRDHNRSEIFNRLAPGLESMLVANATEANARAGRATLVDLTVYPLLLLFCETITQQVLWRYFGKQYKLVPDDIRVTDRVLELTEREKHGEVLTVDEYRKLWKDKPYPDPEIGKIPYVQLKARNLFTTPPDNPTDAPAALPAETANGLTDINAMQAQAAQKADVYSAMLELDKWERVANKSAVKAIDFVAHNIPARVVGIVRGQLSGGGMDVEDVFTAARKSLQSDTSGIMALADAINRLVDKK